MKNEDRKCCGIDVSKDTLDCCFNSEEGKETYFKVSNDEKGFLELFKKCGMRKYTMETSGVYFLKLALWLKIKGCRVHVENSLVVKRFIQMNRERNKNDKKDARWIFRFGCEQETPEWQIPPKEQLECQQLLRGIELLNRQRTMLINQLHGLEKQPWPCKELQRSLRSALRKLEAEIEKLDQLLNEKIGQWKPRLVETLQSIPGLGKRAATSLVVFTDGFSKMENYRQLISMAGLSPREYSSGTSVRARTRICKMGGGKLRNVLYMCAMTAIKYNKACKELYDRLKAKGKNGKLALIAVCNKLLKQAFAIAKSGIPYNENYMSHLPPKT